MNCAIAQTLEHVGEWWTLLVLRNVFCGMTRFDELEEHLGIASNVLAARLRKLVRAGILERRVADDDRRSYRYRLTEKGFDLYPILVAMTEWGEKWAPNGKGARVVLLDAKSKRPIAGISVLSASGKRLDARDVVARAGPGADAKIRALVARRSREHVGGRR